MVKMAEEVQKQLKERMDMDAALVNARFVKPIDEELLRSFADTYELVVTLEENVKDGGFGERVLAFAEEDASVRRGDHCTAGPLYSARKRIIPDETGRLYAGRYLRQN